MGGRLPFPGNDAGRLHRTPGGSQDQDRRHAHGVGPAGRAVFTSIAPKHFVIGSTGPPSIERRQIWEPS